MLLCEETFLKALSYVPQHAPVQIGQSIYNRIKMSIIYSFALPFDILIA